MARNDMTIIVLRTMYFKGDVISIGKIDSNGARQNFTYCTENLFYLKNNQYFSPAIQLIISLLRYHVHIKKLSMNTCHTIFHLLRVPL